MKTNHLRLFLIACAISIGIFFPNELFACTNPPVDSLGFPPYTPVTVYIDPAISGPRRDKVEEAFGNWTTANANNCSNVAFDVVNSPPPGYTDFSNNYQIVVRSAQPLKADGSPSPTSANNYCRQEDATGYTRNCWTTTPYLN